MKLQIRTILVNMRWVFHNYVLFSNPVSYAWFQPRGSARHEINLRPHQPFLLLQEDWGSECSMFNFAYSCLISTFLQILMASINSSGGCWTIAWNKGIKNLDIKENFLTIASPETFYRNVQTSTIINIEGKMLGVQNTLAYTMRIERYNLVQTVKSLFLTLSQKCQSLAWPMCGIEWASQGHLLSHQPSLQHKYQRTC